MGVPPKVLDVWEACGSPSNHRYTWDSKENDNRHEWPVQLRLDRVYLLTGARGGLRAPSSCDGGDGGSDKSAGFVLVGKTRLSECGGRFPSDHWGMWVEFKVNNNKQ